MRSLIRVCIFTKILLKRNKGNDVWINFKGILLFAFMVYEKGYIFRKDIDYIFLFILILWFLWFLGFYLEIYY